MSVNRFMLAVIIVILGAFANPAIAQLPLTQPSTRPDDLSGASRAQYSRLQKQRDAIATQYGLSRKTIEAIALVAIGQKSDFTDAQLVTAVDRLAETARNLLDENNQLQIIVQTTVNSAEREPALAALRRAEVAINDGRFRDAELEYAVVGQIRWEQISGGLTAWDATVSGQASAAILAGDYDRAEDIRMKAGHEARERLLAAGDAIELSQIVAAAFDRYQLGEALGRRASLERAIQIYTAEVLPRISKTNTPLMWAQTQNNLGIVLEVQGTRTVGVQGLHLLEQAITAYQAALEVYSETETPGDWAEVQNNLGNALSAKGERVEGMEGIDTLERSATAYQACMRVFTKAQTPYHWAMTQNNLSSVLKTQGDRTSGPKGLSLIEKAIKASNDASSVFTEAEAPTYWATAQINLGNALRSQGQRINGPKGLSLLAQSVSAYNSALRVFHEADTPSDWGKTQISLSNSLRLQGERTPGPQGLTLLGQAVTASEDGQRVFTEIETPTYWAIAQNNLGLALQAQGDRIPGSKGIPSLENAMKAYQAALKVFSEDEHSAYITSLRSNIAQVQKLLSKRRRQR